MKWIWAKRGNYLQSGASEARRGALKHGARARRWFGRGGVCFNGGVWEALKHVVMELRWFWRVWVCFNGRGMLQKWVKKGKFGVKMVQQDYIWDPLRKKSVRNTPEEAVRQWFISVLHEGMHVPEHMMGSEVALSHAGKDYRADIVVYNRQAQPLMIVECKRPEVPLDQAVVDQALRYNNELNVRYIAITNGLKTFIFERTADGWQFMQNAPLWEEML